jgi:hypothetical protein
VKIKKCCRCGEEKPLDKFYNNQQNGKKRGHCIDCHKVSLLKYDHDVDPSLKELECKVCHLKLPPSAFSLRRRNKTGLNTTCKKCVNDNWVDHRPRKGTNRQITLIECTCVQCGKVFKRAKYLKQVKYCSHDCYHKYQRKNKIFVCEHCGKSFEKRDVKYSDNRTRFCSVGCTNKGLKLSNIRSCQECGKEFQSPPHSKRKYCSQRCSLKASGKIRGHCKLCGKEIPAWQNHSGKQPIYCSHKCSVKDHIVDRLQRKCLHCGHEFLITNAETFGGRGKYCSRKCWRADVDAFRKLRECTCECCGTKFFIGDKDKKRGRGKYCSRDCFAIGNLDYIWYGIVEKMNVSHIYCELWKDVNPRVHAFFDHKCVMCGTPENGRSHSGHHVFYVKEACCWQSDDGIYYTNLNASDHIQPDYCIGENPNYFVILCPSCHCKTNGKFENRKKWADYFKKMIDDYYGGKSYFTKEEMSALSS